MNHTITTPNHLQKNSKAGASTGRIPLRTKSDIATLSQTDIRRMNREDLETLIRLADVPLFRGRVDDHLFGLDRPTLERLAFLAQWTVQNQGH
jgi:hypothetical protein